MNKTLAVSLWFENQLDIDFADHVPNWARELAQGHKDQTIRVLAHEHTAYARSGLLCQVLKAQLWVDEDVNNQLSQILHNAHAKGVDKVIVILPVRASPALWVQWGLQELPQHQAALDEVLILMQLSRYWDHLPHGEARNRMMLADRVLSFDGEAYKADFVPFMRAVNPFAFWVHDGPDVQTNWVENLQSYTIDAPRWREVIKKDDLNAWGARKVVYLSFNQPVSVFKLNELLLRWRSKYGVTLRRMQAVVYVKDEPSPLCVQMVHHLKSEYFTGFWQMAEQPETRMWLWGNDLPGDVLQRELEVCVTG